MLEDECLELSWQDALFKMLPKTGEFSDVSNWRPIAVLKITYKIFAKLTHTRIAPLLDANQCHDQVGFRPNLGVDHAFATKDSIVGKCLEWNEALWIASLDLRKTFDRIEFDSLFAALCHQEIPPPYMHLLSCLYRSQKGHLKDGPRFAIQRGVKQGDVLSPTLFNTGLEHAFRSWKAKLSTQGLHVGVPEIDKCEICG